MQQERERADEAQGASGEGSEEPRAVPESDGAAAADPGAAPDAGVAGSDDGTGGSGAAGDAGAVREPRAGVRPEPESSESSEPSGASAASLEERLAEARREATENRDRALRAHAELENVRRRVERDLQNAHKFALERFVAELLPVRDSLELGLAASAGNEANASGIAEGVELTLRMFEQAMEKFGVRIVDPAGEPFDPEFHQAMTMQESDTAESGTVLTVVQKGCLLNERLVRPAMVIVAR